MGASITLGLTRDFRPSFTLTESDRPSLSIVVRSIGSLLYERVIAHAADIRQVPVAAEVNLEPPNPGSMRFHHRFHFEEVGVLHHGEQSVDHVDAGQSM